SPALAEKEGWVYLANQQKGMRVLDLDPVEIGIVDTDPEFTDVVLPGRDYYPALGTKAVTVWGMVSGDPLDDKWELHVNESVANFKIGGKLNTDGKPENSSPATFKTVSGYREGFATLYIAWDGGSATPWPDNITIKLQAVKKNATLPLMISVNASEQYSYVFTMRHNGNVNFKEVLDGRAIFAADGKESISSGTTPDKQRFDFVKWLLNQVVPRKRSLVFDNLPTEIAETDKKNYPYYSKMTGDNPPVMVTSNRPYLEETEGRFEITGSSTGKSQTSQALEIFRRSFGIDSTTLANASNTMKKVVKDYGNGLTDDQKAKLLYKIVEKETLAGKKVRVPNWFTGLFIDPDNRINGVNGNTVNDTGLYELYKNVVERFIENMINVADRYAGQQSGTVSDNWRSRDNYGPKGCKTTIPPSCVDEHGPGMSYSYGGISDIETFNSQVSAWDAAPNSRYPKNPTNESDAAFYARVLQQQYRGNIDDTTGLMNSNEQNGPVGTKKWAGLRAKASKKEPLTEYRLWEDLFESATCNSTFLSVIRDHAYYPLHWAGIDCAAFVQQVINAADPSTSDSITDPPDVKTTVMDLDEYGEKCDMKGSDRAKRAWVEYFFVESNPVQRAYVSDIPKTEGADRVKRLRLLQKGDLLRYPPSSNISHVSMVHSDQPTCTNPNNSTTCTYEIIHAYGVTPYTPINESGEEQVPVFSRKVIKTKQNIGVTPSGFGRIKLWD
ncbi:MAG TPA: hypothetical protein VIH42_13765, partial [Thermoguttaceae bacterium]